MLTRDRAMMDSLPADRFVSGAMGEFLQGAGRLERLNRYAMGQHDVLTRSRRAGPNARLPHGFPRYIAQMTAGYMLSHPVRYEGDGQEKEVKELRAACHAAEADSADVELALDQAVYGRAVSLCYLAEGVARVAALDPRSAFVVYDATVEKRPLMGIALSPRRDEHGRPDGAFVSAYTAREVWTWTAAGEGAVQGAPHRAQHGFDRVPMVEYLNDEHARGDFEDVLPLIDAYDLLASDRVNDRAQFADALLVLTGVMGISSYDEDDPRTGMERLRQERTLSLPDRDAKAEWLVKTPVEADIDVLRRAIAGDIHKFSMTPDFGDESFAGNVSGVAIRYKLFCLEQKIGIKERWFVKGLRERARVMAGWLKAQGRPAPDVERLTISLVRRLPESDLERARMLDMLRDILPGSVLRDNAPLRAADGGRGSAAPPNEKED